jgi:phospho-N-acetylmuramoyl-pentapeptide-transferase
VTNFLYSFIFPFILSYVLTFLTSLLLISKARILVSKPKPELEGFHEDKANIPNIGGVSFVISTMVTTSIFAQIDKELLYFISAIFSFALLGFVDDFYKKDSSNGDGIKSTTKLIWQIIISVVFVVYGTKNNYISSGIAFLERDELIIRVIENVCLIFLLVYFVNAFNITDGLDGLAGYVSLPLCVLLIMIAILVPSNKLILVLSVSIFASVLAFLKFNRYPAKYFMGDCGSMALGATLLLIAYSLNIATIFIIASLMLSVELFTSLIQIVAIRIFKKKVFSIAPIHHLFEKKGESEVKIVNQFTRISALFSIIALLVFCYLHI